MAKKQATLSKREAGERAARPLHRGLLKAFAPAPSLPPAGTGSDAAEAAAAAAAAADTAVMFQCTNPLCIVGIKIEGVPPLTFSGQQGISLPSGTRTLGWKVKSSPSGQAFSITVTGATLDVPIQGTTGSGSGGVRQLTV